jgi:hypothetical protein
MAPPALIEVELLFVLLAMSADSQQSGGGRWPHVPER